MNEERAESVSQETPRREFLRELAALGVGGLAGISLLSSEAEAFDRGYQTLDLGGKAASVQQFKEVFTSTKELDKADPQLATHLEGLSGMEQMAAMSIIAFAQANPRNKDLGLHLAGMFHFTIVGVAMSAATSQGLAPGKMPTAQQVQQFTQKLAFGGFLCPEPTGWVCGGGCPKATGWGCGSSCENATSYAVDPEGLVLNDDILKSGNLIDFDKALLNAAEAYDQIF